MPEGPEIRLSSDFFNHYAKGKEIKEVSQFSNPRNGCVISNLTGTGEKLNYVKSRFRGKQFQFYFFDPILKKVKPYTVGFGMTGMIGYVTPDESIIPFHTRWQITFNDSSSLIFIDPRKFASWKNGLWDPNRGPCPMTEKDEFRQHILENELKITKKPLHQILMDQSIFNGVGNYLRSTICYYLDVDPFIPVRKDQLGDLTEMVINSLETAYIYGGGQLYTWKNPFGAKAEKFSDWVYYQKGNSVVDKTGKKFWYNPKYNPK